MSNPTELLHSWLTRQLAGDAATWLSESLTALQSDSSDRTFYKLFGFVPRKLGKDDLQLSDDDLAAANAARAGWNPSGWSVDQAARVLLLLKSESDPQKLFARSEQLFITADVGELVALYRGLPLYPQPELYAKRGPEGLRTNIKSVFEAIAHRNPFPREQFSEDEWNQMVLKALFIESPLWPIQGLDERTNAPLARMLIDFAHERWAAGRTVPLELWRCVGPHADEQAIADLTKVLGNGNETEQKAAALALSVCPHAAAQVALQSAPALASAISDGTLSWGDVASQG